MSGEGRGEGTGWERGGGGAEESAGRRPGEGARPEPGRSSACADRRPAGSGLGGVLRPTRAKEAREPRPGVRGAEGRETPGL